jgi:hypothetical protein
VRAVPDVHAPGRGGKPSHQNARAMMGSERPDRAGRVPQAQLSSVSEPYRSSVTLSRTIFLNTTKRRDRRDHGHPAVITAMMWMSAMGTNTVTSMTRIAKSWLVFRSLMRRSAGTPLRPPPYTAFPRPCEYRIGS